LARISKVATDWHEHNDTTTHYAAIHCSHQQTIKAVVQLADIPLPQSATLELYLIARKLLLISHPVEGRRLSWPYLQRCLSVICLCVCLSECACLSVCVWCDSQSCREQTNRSVSQQQLKSSKNLTNLNVKNCRTLRFVFLLLFILWVRLDYLLGFFTV